MPFYTYNNDNIVTNVQKMKREALGERPSGSPLNYCMRRKTKQRYASYNFKDNFEVQNCSY